MRYGWWARQGLNLRPPPCQGGALPLSYTPIRLAASSVRPPPQQALNTGPKQIWRSVQGQIASLGGRTMALGNTDSDSTALLKASMQVMDLPLPAPVDPSPMRLTMPVQPDGAAGVCLAAFGARVLRRLRGRCQAGCFQPPPQRGLLRRRVVRGRTRSRRAVAGGDLSPRLLRSRTGKPGSSTPQCSRRSCPPWVNTSSARVVSGPRHDRAGWWPRARPSISRKLRFAEAESRVRDLLAALPRPAERADHHDNASAFGVCLLIDCHSMPAAGTPSASPGGKIRADFVLGDVHGTTCAPHMSPVLSSASWSGFGYRVGRNDPYAGGYVTRHYGRPSATACMPCRSRSPAASIWMRHASRNVPGFRRRYSMTWPAS